jgi:hypothetical protein
MHLGVVAVDTKVREKKQVNRYQYSWFKTPLAGLVLMFLLTTVAPTASADIMTYSIGTASPGYSLSNLSYPGPYGTLTINLVDAKDATLTFTALTTGGNQYLMGDGGLVGINVNAAKWTVSTPSVKLSDGTINPPSTWDNIGGGGYDGMGILNQKFSSHGQNSQGPGINTYYLLSQFSFTLTDTSGTWLSAANVLTRNSQGVFAAAKFYVCPPNANGCTANDPNNFNLPNGYARVPDGGLTLMLLGGALAGIETLRRLFAA